MYKESIPPKKGGGKKKGAAESDYISEAGDVAAETAQKNLGAPPRKKGATRTVEQLKAKKQEMQETRADKKMGVKAYNKKIGRLNKKIERKGGTVPGVAKYQEEGAAQKWGGNEGDYKRHMDAQGHMTKDGDVGGHYKDYEPGANRMGFTQNFGAARQNSYAKGAARVASIMSFGASKKKGAADSGHGEPVGHDHPTKTIKSRQVSGGGSDSSSSSVSNSNIPKASGGEQTKNISGYMTALNKRFPNTSGADLASKKYISSDMVGNYDSNFRSNSNSSSNPRGVSESSQTTVSPMSMSETLKSGQLQTENRNETNKFNRDITNITATNDSIVAANEYIDLYPAYNQNNPKVLSDAGRRGGLAAKTTRQLSGDFDYKKASDMFKAGQNPEMWKKKQEIISSRRKK